MEKYTYSSNDDGNIPKLPSRKDYNEDDNNDEVRAAASTEELARIVNADRTQKDDNPLNYDEILTVNQIPSSTQILESISVDEVIMKFFVVCCINDLWKSAFRD